MKLKKQICSVPIYDEIQGEDGQFGIVCINVKESLQFRLDASRGNLRTSGEVLLNLSGDFGQEWTKISIALGAATCPNSVNNHFISAAFPAKDTRVNLLHYAAPLWEQIEQLRELEMEGEKKTVKW